MNLESKKYDASVITANLETANFFDEMMKEGISGKMLLLG